MTSGVVSCHALNVLVPLHLRLLQTKRDECVVLHGKLLSCLVLSLLPLVWRSGCVLIAKCFNLTGPEAEECQKLIAAHKACLRKEGFNVSPFTMLDTCKHSQT